MDTKIVIAGCCGKMGRSIASLALADKDFEIIGATETRSHPNISTSLGKVIGEEALDIDIKNNLSLAVKGADVIIDFTTPVATLLNLKVARSEKIPIVIGTTGLMDEEQRGIEASSKIIPVLVSSNMSIGINLLFHLAPEVASALGEDYDIEIIEMHHNKKKDSPSGTAMTLAQRIAEARGKRIKDIVVYGREGNAGQRGKDEIGIHAVRAGDIIGEHTVIYAGKNERIEITHRANSRDIFARGALCAAKYIADKSPGLYNMQDVIEGV